MADSICLLKIQFSDLNLHFQSADFKSNRHTKKLQRHPHSLVETKLPALEVVRRASKNKIGRFNKQNIRELCPTLSDSSIEGALRKLVAAGELKKEEKGKNTCYFRLN